MNFLWGLLGSVAHITAGFFVTLGLMHGSIATSTALVDVPTDANLTLQPVISNEATSVQPTDSIEVGASPATREMSSESPANRGANEETDTPGTVVCQGTTREACPSGQTGTCMPDGNYYCSDMPVAQSQPAKKYTLPSGAVVDANGSVISQGPTNDEYIPATQPTQPIQQNATAVNQTVLEPLNTEIDELQSEQQACTDKMLGSSAAVEGGGAIAAQAQAASCQNISSELSVFLEAQRVTQAGALTYACFSKILNLETQIASLRQKALGEEAGYLTTGTYSIGQARAAQVAQIETQQETPLLQEVQQNLYYCQS